MGRVRENIGYSPEHREVMEPSILVHWPIKAYCLSHNLSLLFNKHKCIYFVNFLDSSCLILYHKFYDINFQKCMLAKHKYSLLH